MEVSRREVIGWAVASALVVAGVVTLLVVRNLSTDFGYVGPPPLLDGAYIPGASETTRTLNLLAAGVMGLGLMTGAFMAGLRGGGRGHTSAPRKELIRWVTAVALVVAGVVALNVAMNRPSSFGWFAYAPLSETSYMPGASGTTLALTAAGLLFLAVGLLATGVLAGLRVRRRGRASSLGHDRGNTEAE